MLFEFQFLFGFFVFLFFAEFLFQSEYFRLKKRWFNLWADTVRIAFKISESGTQNGIRYLILFHINLLASIIAIDFQFTVLKGLYLHLMLVPIYDS